MCSSVVIFVILGVLSVPGIIQGQFCPRSNKDPNKNCARGCIPSLGCGGRKQCICDGDCGYSCIKKGMRCNSPSPRTLTNGRRLVNGRNFNETVVFTCDPGFTLSGSSVRRCRGLRTWDGIEPKCGQNCDDPGVANNTFRREPVRSGSSKAVFKASETLHYYCDSGYHIEGKDTITCQVNGSWDSIAPKCYRTSCPPPTLPAEAAVFFPSWFNTSSGGRNGRKLLLKCNPGYIKMGSPLMACMGNNWTISKSFKCSPKSCGDPGEPRNGRRSGLVYTFRSKVTFTCNKCYILVGESYRVCNADGTWSDKVPVCQRAVHQCKAISSSSISNGMVSVTSTNCRRTATFTCDRGHELIGSRQISCENDGQWSKPIPRCQPVSCMQLNVSEPVQAVVSGNKYLSKATFSCPKHYVMSGADSISCKEDGEWSGNVPHCLAPCHFVPSKNLTSEKKIYRHGTNAELKCHVDFFLLGTINNEMPLCSNGTWKLRGRRFSWSLYCEEKEVTKNKQENFFDGILASMCVRGHLCV